MKATELRDMKALELNRKLSELKQELFNLRFQHAINQLENPQRIVIVRREIARVKTVMHEQGMSEVVLKTEPAAPPEKKAKKAEDEAKAEKAAKPGRQAKKAAGAADEKPEKPKRAKAPAKPKAEKAPEKQDDKKEEEA